MDKHNCNKGSILIDVLIIMAIISVFELLMLRSYKPKYFDDIYFKYDYLQLQSEAIKTKEELEMDLSKYNLEIVYPVRFNAEGNINIAQTIFNRRHNIVIHLGNGRIEND